MIRNLARRFAMLGAAVSVLLAGPGSAIAHGFAHHEAAEHAAHDGVSAPHGVALIGAVDHDGDHPHPRLDAATPAGLTKGSFGVRSEAVAPTAVASIVLADALAADPNETPPDTPGNPPTRSRAPPAL